jgi:hypothetical protein
MVMEWWSDCLHFNSPGEEERARGRHFAFKARMGRHNLCRGREALSLPTFQLSPVGSSDWSKRFETSSQAAEKSSPAGSSGRQRRFIHFNSCRSSRHGDRALHAILAN